MVRALILKREFIFLTCLKNFQTRKHQAPELDWRSAKKLLNFTEEPYGRNQNQVTGVHFIFRFHNKNSFCVSTASALFRHWACLIGVNVKIKNLCRNGQSAACIWDIYHTTESSFYRGCTE